MADSINPIVVKCSPPSPSSGDVLEFTVDLSGDASGNESYPIAVSYPSAFSSIPASVSPTEGADSCSFSGTLVSGWTGSLVITVYGASGSAFCNVNVT